MPMKILGITGGVGTGKSTVLDYLEKTYDALVIQCDAVAAVLQKKDGAVYTPMRELLKKIDPEERFLMPDGEFDRKAVAGMVFADPAILTALNRIVHPAVKASVIETLRQARQTHNTGLAVIEAALLLEDHYDLICDEVWFIYTKEDIRAKRLAFSRGYSPGKIRQIMDAQKSDDFYRRSAALTIDNSSENVQNTYDQIDEGLRTHGFLQYCQRQQW